MKRSLPYLRWQWVVVTLCLSGHSSVDDLSSPVGPEAGNVFGIIDFSMTEQSDFVDA